MNWLSNSGSTKKVSFPPRGLHLSQEVQQLKENISSTPAVQTSISAIQSVPLLLRGYSGYIPCATLWFRACDHEEDMQKWDRKSTLTIKAQAHELQGKTITKGSSSRKINAPVSGWQFPRQNRRVSLTFDLNKRTSDFHLQEVTNEYYDQD